MFISANEGGGVPAAQLGVEEAVAALRAAGEPTRLRLLALLSHGELAVGELAEAVGQSQPRVSRHLRLLTEQGLVRRAREGAWVFYRLAEPESGPRKLIDALIARIDPADENLQRDRERLRAIRTTRDEAAAAYFARVAPEWSRLRALHLPEAEIEAAMLAAAGPGPFQQMVDVGVGAGRVIQVFAPRIKRALGIDTSRQMLAVARAELDELPPGMVELRYGDAYAPPAPAGSADLVTIHQVLHFLADPGRAITEALRLLRPGGRLIIVDFAQHAMEALREAHAHRRLGFADADIEGWCAAGGGGAVSATSLAPPGDAGAGPAALTVKVWNCVREPGREGARDGGRP